MQTLADLILRHGLIKATNKSKKTEVWEKIYPAYKRETNEDISKEKLKKRWQNEIDRLKKQQRTYKADVMKTGKSFQYEFGH